ncbi:hypothetical protein Dxin01_02682 [Deinococcus xinjiangensis]|uniref:Lipoprotein n=1 Tax=Deinococcus xinjiangensis TaxID=457454 RepID=A0ABP9VCH0_9DEIO
MKKSVFFVALLALSSCSPQKDQYTINLCNSALEKDFPKENGFTYRLIKVSKIYFKNNNETPDGPYTHIEMNVDNDMSNSFPKRMVCLFNKEDRLNQVLDKIIYERDFSDFIKD